MEQWRNRSFLKLLLLPLLLLTFGCEKDEILTDFENQEAPTTSVFIPQTIYPTSIQNHEWNNFFYDTRKEFIHNGGTSVAYFLCAFSYFDYENDGDWDIFVGTEYVVDSITQEQLNDTDALVGVLVNKGVKNGVTQWEWKTDIIDFQARHGYRKMATADLDNDGDLDFVGFIASDADSEKGTPILGGIDAYINDNGKFKYKVIHPLSVGMVNFMHNGTLGDVNGDGLVDIVSGTQTIKLWLNRGNNEFGTYIEPTRYKTIGEHSNYPTGSFSTELFDINGDGYNDLLVGSAKGIDYRYYNYYTDEDYAKHSEIFFGKAEYPYFSESPDIELEPDYQFVGEDNWILKTWTGNMDWSIGDVDNDGDYDFFIYLMRDCNPELQQQTGCNNYYISYYENVDNKNFVPKTEEIFHTNEQFFGNLPITYIKTWDVDNDGKSEIVLEASQGNFNVWKQIGGKFRKTNN